MSISRLSETKLYVKLRELLGRLLYFSERRWAQLTHRSDWLLRRMFNRWARWGAGEQMESDHAWFTEQVFERMNLSPSDRILELACGSGWASRRMARRAGESAHVVGLDLAEEMLRHARAESSEFRNISFVQASAEQIPCTGEYFTKVLSVESFYFFGNQEKVLRELLRVAANRGQIYLLLCLYKDNPEALQWVGNLNIPVRLRSAEEYQTLLHDAGWADIETEIVENPGPPGSRPTAHGRALLIMALKPDSASGVPSVAEKLAGTAFARHADATCADKESKA